MDKQHIKNILSLDAGASKVKAVIFNESGETLSLIENEFGANISIDPEESIKRILSTVSEILDNSNLNYDEIAHYSLGVAGISNKDARDLLFKKLEEKQISRITHLSSDVNPVFEMNCSDNSALLVSVGTGCICLGRDDENKIIKSAGMGLDKDPGSGFWMGRELIVNLSFSRNLDQDETEFQELLDMSLNHFDAKELNLAVDEIMESDDRHRQIASLSKPLIALAEKGNQIALSIVQQSSQHIAETILVLVDQILYPGDELLIITNGSIMNNPFYMDSLADAIRFDFKSIKWLTPTISTAYYPGLLSCKILGLDVGVKDIVSGSAFA